MLALKQCVTYLVNNRRRIQRGRRQTVVFISLTWRSVAAVTTFNGGVAWRSVTLCVVNRRDVMTPAPEGGFLPQPWRGGQPGACASQ